MSDVVKKFLTKNEYHETRIPQGNPDDVKLDSFVQVLKEFAKYVRADDRFGSQESQEIHAELVHWLSHYVSYEKEFIEELEERGYSGLISKAQKRIDKVNQFIESISYLYS